MIRVRTLFLILLPALMGVLLQACAPAVVIGAAATGVALHHSPRTTEAMMTDNTIEMSLNRKIRAREDWRDRSNITVTAYNRQVLLTGQIPSADLRDELLALASNSEDVRKVYNAVAVRAPTTYEVRNHDLWLTSKVKARLVGRSDVDGARVLVHTQNGSVYLMGLVTREEAEIATRVASEIEGVNKVVKVFEYVKDTGK